MAKRSKLERHYLIVGWVFILPSAVFLLVSKFYPMIQALILSFQRGIGDNLSFAGIYNYRHLLEDKVFLTSLSNTLLYLVLQVPLMLFIALILGTLLNDPKLKWKGLFRTAIFLPCVMAVVSYSLVFRSMFSLDGLINTMLIKFGLIDTGINWFGSAWLARIVIVLAITWRWTGYNAIYYLAGLQHIDPEVYEAAKIDGASPVKSFFKITIPLLKPIILFTAITSTNGTLQLFAEPKNITNGGPAYTTLAVSNHIYNVSFEFLPQYGYAAAISYVILLIVAALALIQMMVGDKR